MSEINPPLQPTHPGGTNVPADYRDPTHPHNGDIEGHIGTSAAKPFPKKRIILGVVLGLAFLGALGASTGTGFWYGKTQTKKPLNSALRTVIVTATQPTTTELMTQSKNITTTVEAYIKPTKTRTVTSLPTSDACLISNLFLTRGQCEDECKGISKRHETRCEADGIGWRCHHCVFLDNGSCKWDGAFDSFGACAIQCMGMAGKESPHCVADGDNRFWHCYKCPVKEETATVPFETPNGATRELPSGLPEATPVPKETATVPFETPIQATPELSSGSPEETTTVPELPSGWPQPKPVPT